MACLVFEVAAFEMSCSETLEEAVGRKMLVYLWVAVAGLVTDLTLGFLSLTSKWRYLVAKHWASRMTSLQMVE